MVPTVITLSDKGRLAAKVRFPVRNMAVSVDFMATQETDETKNAAVSPNRSASSVDKWTCSSVVGAGASSKGSSSGAAPSSGSVLAISADRGDGAWLAGSDCPGL
mgnify:CR=1 FL=1